MLLAAIAVCEPARALEWSLEARELSAAGVSVQRLNVESGSTRVGALELAGVRAPVAGDLGGLALRCASAGRIVECARGRLTWLPDAQTRHQAVFSRGPDRVELRAGATVDETEGGLEEASERLSEQESAQPGRQRPAGEFAAVIRYGSDGPGFEASGLDLALLPAAVVDAIGLAALSGDLGLEASARGDGLQLDAQVSSLGFDTPDGSLAGEGVALELALEVEPDSENDQHPRGASFDTSVRWRAGELLLGPAYLPAPESVVELAARGRWSPAGSGRVVLEAARLSQADVVEVAGSARLGLGGMPPVIEAAELRVERLDLAPAWAAGLDSLASASGLSALEPSGGIRADAAFSDGAFDRLELVFEEVSVDDPQGRLGLSGLDGSLTWRDQTLALAIDFDAAALYRIPLGASRLRVRAVDGTLELTDPFELPVLDGALMLERFIVRDWLQTDREFEIDARLEPLDLAALTDALGWQRLGGSLSGRFPGVRFADGVLDFDGSIDVALFSGTATIQGLSIERPLGTLPALAADIEFELLDLDQVTGAFEFGAMSGRLSGYMRGLRLLDWQPVAFDAWLYTPRDADGKRRISQKAVDSISSLGGGGAAMLSAPLLSLFDDFGYRQVGLGCRLSANVCRMRGLEDVESGGYRIVEGRGIPRLDVIGFQRRVDWPQLLAQLRSAASGGAPETGSGPD